MISIITATNRQNPTFIHTVNCVMAQTYKDFEWVILDNSVNGYVKPFFEAYKQKYPQYSENFNRTNVLNILLARRMNMFLYITMTIL